MIAGEDSPVSLTTSEIVATVPRPIFESGREPFCTIATGVFPLSQSLKTSTISFNFFIPIRITTVALDFAARFKSLESCPVLVVPVTTQKLSDTPRCVSGIFSRAGTESALLIPGITLADRPHAVANSTSSNPSSKNKGIATFQPAPHAHETAGIFYNQFVDLQPAVRCAFLPFCLQRFFWPGLGHRSDSSSLTSASYNTTSASASALIPFTVIKSGSPGPAPHKCKSWVNIPRASC
jgi:hypothetical protein